MYTSDVFMCKAYMCQKNWTLQDSE